MDIFITGATGFIGGSVAAGLLASGHRIRGLVRGDKAAALAAKGIEPVPGTLADRELLVAEARRADAVVNAASSDNRGALEALIEGLSGSGKRLVHTSGSSLVGDDAKGEWASDRVYDETSLPTPTPDKAARVAIDNLVRAATDRGVVSTVLCNTLIYGTGLGVNAHSVQLPRLVAQARKSGIARHVGHGRNIWSNVHVEDVAEIYRLALEAAPAGSFYFVENGEAAFSEMTAAIARRLGLGPAQDWPIEEAIQEWGYEHATYALGCNSRVTARLAKTELGWKPRHASVVEWIEKEMPVG
jgi:nucleoside-diphosphate-sugar epimerase